MKKSILIIIVILFVSIKLSAQTDTVKKQDETLVLMRKADSIKIADSLNREVLKKQLNELASNEIRKRKELEKQLSKLTQLDSLRRIKNKNEIDSLKNTAKGYPIVPYKDTIFYIFTKIGNITATERSEIINERLKTLYQNYILKFDSLHIIDFGQSVDIAYKDKTIMSITEYDAMWFGKSKLDIANEYKTSILKDLEVFKKNTSLFTIIKQIGLVFLVVVVLIAFIIFINYLFKKKVDLFIKNQQGKRIKGIKIKDYQFLDAEKQTNVVLFLSKTFRLFVILILLYIALPILFSIFPPTQRLAETLFGYVLTPLKKAGISFLNFLPNLFAIIIIAVITRYILKFLKYITEEISSGNLKIEGFFPEWARSTFNIVRFMILAFMFVVMFPYLPGSDSPVFQGVTVFMGILFSLGSSSVIGNMIAGVVMTYMRPFQIGDRIKFGDITGDVVEKTPFVVRIRTIKNEYITVPNSNILSSNVINYNTSKQSGGIILHTTVTIGYDVPWKDIHNALIVAALKTELILQNPKPFVLQTSLDDFYVSYQINAYSDEPNKQATIYSNLHQNIQDTCNERGIEILSPHYRAQRDGNMVTIPVNYLPDDYKSPQFGVNLTNINFDKKSE